MKRSFAHPRLSKVSGFTLIELLVVIAIIAILASVILVAGGAAIRAADRAKAANTANQIQTAALAYNTEYSLYPVPSGTTADYLIGDSTAANGASWASLLYCLSGNLSPSTGLTTPTPSTLIANTRGIAFLNLKSSDVYPNGSAVGVQDAPINPLATGTEIYFNIAIDGDYSGVMGDGAGTPASAITGASSTNGLPNFAKSTTTAMDWTGTSTAGVAVWANCNGSTTSTNPSFWVHTY